MPHFLVDASLPRAVADLVRVAGFEATDVRSIGLGAAPDDRIAVHARMSGFVLIARDRDFGDVRRYPPKDYLGIVIIDAPEDAGREMILEIVRRFLKSMPALGELRERLFIVEIDRIRFHPA